MANTAYNTPSNGPLGEQNFGADWNAGVTTQHFVLTTEAGVSIFLWVDSTNRLRIKATTAPTSDTDGTVVGTQT
jgi:hypothetical protein